MQLESARSLKTEIFRRVIGNDREYSAAVHLAVAAGVMPNTREPQRLVSVGLAPGKHRDVRIAVRVQRRALLDGPMVAKIRSIAGNEVDVRYVGRIQKRALPWYRRRQRPMLIGCSIGHFAITAGTLGCFVRKVSDELPMILSNNHVLADENNGKAGDPIIQQGAYDGGTRNRDTVARLASFIPLRRNKSNLVDAATASVRSSIKFVSASIKGLGRLAGVAAPLGDTGGGVAKVGRTTGLTRGRITAFELDDVVIAYDLGNVRFDNQIEIEGSGTGSFSDGGDSGSLIVNEALEGVALLFAGSDQGGTNGAGLTYANPLDVVLERLRVELLV